MTFPSLLTAIGATNISHGVSAYEIAEGAFTIAQSYRYFPRGTVHVVVDPGVGTSRRPILAQAAGHYFVAPDNGVLSLVYAREKHKVRAITTERYFRQPVSNTFHGRDIFSPVAAHLAGGVTAARFGKLIDNYLRSDFDKPVRTGRRTWTGAILRVDRLGNIVTNFSVTDFPDLGKRDFAMAVGPQRINVLAQTYAERGPGEPFLIVGSAGYYEISVAQGSASKLLGCAAGAPLELDSWATIRKQDYFNNSWRVTLLHRNPQVIESSGFQGRSPWLAFL